MKTFGIIGLGQFGNQIAVSLSQKGFEVVAIEEGQGNWAGVAKRVTCRLPDGRTFGAGIKGTRERGIDLLNESHHIVTIIRGKKPSTKTNAKDAACR